jgi:glycosyltransferase involved in cell wall biosynthesis
MKRLNIAITVDPYIPVPPIEYGGIERIVDFVVNGLIERGHAVTLYAHPESHRNAKLIPYGAPPHFTKWARVQELWQVGSKLSSEVRHLDAILSWGRLAALLPVLANRRVAKLQCYCRDFVPWRSVRIATTLAGSSILFSGCSRSVYRNRPQGDGYGRWVPVHYGVDVTKYTPVTQVSADAPLAFLGRLERFKGVHSAIEIAKRSGRRLIIAGNKVTSGADGQYFEEAVAPHLDGDQIRYIGPVNDAEKNELLGSCAAFLMPIEWEEPFGIVMAEALACGTPVIAFDRGSVPEVVLDGINGFRCKGSDDAVAAVHKLGQIDRSMVRSDCEKRFSSDFITSSYESLLQEMISGLAPGK